MRNTLFNKVFGGCNMKILNNVYLMQIIQHDIQVKYFFDKICAIPAAMRGESKKDKNEAP